MNMKKLLTLITVVLLLLGAGAIAFTGAEEELQYDFAYELFLNNNFTMSEKILSSLIAESPESGLAGSSEFLRGENLYNSGNYREAMDSYLSIIEKYPKIRNKYKKELYFRLAECFFRLRDYESSVRYSQIVANGFPDSYLAKDAILLAGENLYLSERYDEASEMLMRLEKYPDYRYFDYVYYIMGRIYYEKALAFPKTRSQSADESIKYFNRVRVEFPDSGIINHSEFRRANTYYLIGKYRTALKIIRKTEENEKDEKFRLLLKYYEAWNLYMLEDYKAAVKAYEDITASGDEGVIVMWSEYKKGLCYEAMKDDKKADTQFKKVIELYPKTIPSAFSEYAIATALYNKGKLYESLSAFRGVIDDFGIEELTRASYYMMAEIYTQLGKFFKAKDVYSEIEQKIPQDKYIARYLQAWCLHKEREFAKSGEMLEKLAASSDVPPDIRIKSLIKAGDNYYELEMDGDAEKKYDEAINMAAGYPELRYEAIFAKAWIYYRKNDLKEAEKLFNKIKKNSPSAETRYRADFMLANAFYSAKKYTAALTKYLTLTEDNKAPESIRDESAFYAGWCYYRMEKFDIAVDFWGNYINRVSDRVKKAEAYYRIGWAFFRQNKFDEAIKNFTEITENYKDTHFYPEALLKIGDTKYNKKDYEGAIAAYRVLVDSRPDHYRIPEALYGIQWSYYQLGQYEKAIELSKEFLEKYKGSSFAPEIQYRVAEHYYNAKKYETAIEEFRKFYMKNQEHELADNALYWMGLSNLKIRQYNRAVTDFKTLLLKFPESNFRERTLFKTANAYFKLHEYEFAIDYYKKYSEENPKSQYVDDSYFNIALASKKLKRFDEAKEWYLKIVDGMPESPMRGRATMNLAYLYQDEKDYDKAVETFRKVVSMKDKKAVEAQFWIGDIYASKKDNKNAIKEYLKVYENYPDRELWAVSALDAAARLYEKDGKLKSAISAYKKISKVTKQKKYTDTADKKISLLEEQYKLLHPAGETKGPVRKQEGGAK